MAIELPTLFRGVMWDAHWEYDAPCVVYSPFKRYGFGGNSHHIDDMVQNICFDILCGKEPRRDFSEGDIKEFKWRGWSPRGFAKRNEAWHVEIGVVWIGPADDLGRLNFEMVNRREQWGPFDGGRISGCGKPDHG